MDRIGGPIGVWRLGVVLLAAGVWLHQFTQVDLADFGWQFRYVAIWALTLSLVSGALVFQAGLDPEEAPPHTLIAATAAANAVAVVLHWRFHVLDPSQLVYEPARSWQHWYLFAVGPALQWIEAVALSRSFTRLLAPAGWFAGLAVLYVAWIEGAVSPLNEVPGGGVTTGLPYPFLNDMAAMDRLGFYAGSALLGLAAVVALSVLQRASGGRPPAAPLSA